MRLVIKENIYGWIMTGLIGKNGLWFLGFSKNTNTQVTKMISNDIEYKEVSKTRWEALYDRLPIHISYNDFQNNTLRVYADNTGKVLLAKYKDRFLIRVDCEERGEYE